MAPSQIALTEDEVRLLLACLENAVPQELVVDYQRLLATTYAGTGMTATALHQRVSRLARKAGVKIRGDGRKKKGIKRKAKETGKPEENKGEDEDEDEDNGVGDDAAPTTTKKPRLDDDDDEDMAGGGGGAAAATATATIAAAA